MCCWFYCYFIMASVDKVWSVIRVCVNLTVIVLLNQVHFQGLWFFCKCFLQALAASVMMQTHYFSLSLTRTTRALSRGCVTSSHCFCLLRFTCEKRESRPQTNTETFHVSVRTHLNASGDQMEAEGAEQAKKSETEMNSSTWATKVPSHFHQWD